MVNNEQVYDALAKPVVTSATDGINGVIFAYGQTAAGKTYTMLGTEGDPGVTRRSIAEVFRLIAACTNRQFLLRASYIEIYNEIIRDLLQPDNDNLKIHEDVFNKRVFVDSREEVVTSVAQVMDIIARGETARAVGETNMNERSSRSHTIFSLKIESRELTPQEEHGEEPPSDDGVAVRASTLSLVDLAGSERASFTKAQGMRLVEGGHINKSLLTLGNVINKLSSGEAGSIAHIPYRDSKLTRLLQPALGGNARTAIVCAVTPAVLHMEETLSTLKFASRAKKVTNHAKTNEFLDDRAKLRRAEKELAALRAENEKLKTGVVPVADGGIGSGSKQGANLRVVAFGRKFDMLVKQMKDANAGHAVAPSLAASLSWSKSQSCNLVSALTTVESLKSKGRAAHSMDSSAEASDLRTKVLVAEKRALEAERRERQAIAEIRYERQAMMAEVEALVSTCEEVEAARCEAERECARANSALAGSITGLIVNDVVTEAVIRAEVRGEVREMGDRLVEMEVVKEKNSGLRQRLGELEKEHAEVVKREKRGVGPVMREMKILQGKLGEAEKKCKTLRQTSNKLGSEKVALERELKEIMRKNKVLTGEIEKHRGHQSKGQERVNRQLTEERKRFEASEKEMKEEIAALLAKVKEGESGMTDMSRAMGQLEGEVKGIGTERDALRDAKRELSAENEELRDKLQKVEEEGAESKEEIRRLGDATKRHGQEVQELEEELGKCQLEMEECRSELQAVTEKLQEAENNTHGMSAMLQESRKRVEELEAIEHGLEAAIKDEQSGREVAEEQVKDLGGKLAQQLETVKKLKEIMEAHEPALQKRDSELREANETVGKLECRIEELEKQRRQVEEHDRAERAKLQNELTKKREMHQRRLKELEEESMEEVEKIRTELQGVKGERGKLEELHQRRLKELEEESMGEVGRLRTELQGVRKERGNLEKMYQRRLKELEDECMGEVEKVRTELQGVRKEKGKLEYEVEKQMTETATRTREVLKLSEAIQVRDRKIYGLQDRFEEMSRAEGVVGKLEERCRRRELMIGELNRRLEVVQEAADKGNIGDELRNTERMVYLESKNAALLVEHGQFQVRLGRLEKEKEAVVEESRRLRERLKDNDLRRVREAAERKEADLEEMKRKHRGGLKEVNINIGTSATRSCESK